MQLEEALAAVVAEVERLPRPDTRRLIAIAGPPASGKSTLAEVLAETLPDACVVPMDGFHLDNRILSGRNLLHRKGAPMTFDVAGFRHLLARLKTENEVHYPIFDRSLDCAIAGAGVVGQDTKTVVIEGNYLLLDAAGWRALRPLWDFAAYLSVPEDVLQDRLMQRWAQHGFSRDEAAQKTETNDLPNARTTVQNMLEPDLLLTGTF
ncbi:MAG: nucleoside/nucleotide kinase family protein [Pseudomonadota bacterium]